MSKRPWYTQPWFHVAVILLVAGVFRLWRITSLPPGLFGDEATDGLDALDVLAGRGAVFFPANFGREGLHMWIVAAAFRLLDVTPLALRLPSAVAGILTALATYWLGHELVMAEEQGKKEGGRRRDVAPGGETSFSIFHLPSSIIPLIAALYLATSYWHVHFSRFGIRGVFTPLCGALAFAAFWRAVNRGSNLWFAVAGFWLGLAMHFYTASRFFPFFLAGFLLVQWAAARLTHGEAILPRHWRGILLMVAVAGVVFAPLGLYFLQHPGSFAQRASAVTAFGAENTFVRMGQAALANVLQFFVPGRGDMEQFYNLPGRAVFDGVTALLALAGIGVLLWRWQRAPALFLLLWFPALLLPSFLATDRWPTLPRVLGVIPGVYFFPAIGLLALAGWLGRKVTSFDWRRIVIAGESSTRSGGFRLLTTLLVAAALVLHAGLTYRDYFHIWGPSQATFDAFEGDMTAAWRWLEAHAPTEDAQPAPHVFLSSDIYRHPTFMLLHERATVQTYFTHANPRLSWFDARSALPLPAGDEPTVYIIPASAPPAEEVAALLAAASTVESVTALDGSRALQVFTLAPGAAVVQGTPARAAPVEFTRELTLTAARLARGSDRGPQLTLFWRTGGPDPAEWPGYRLEIELPVADGGVWATTLPFEAFRAPEWTVDGAFMTWHTLDGLTGDPAATGRLRLVRVRDEQPVVTEAAPDGWHAVRLVDG